METRLKKLLKERGLKQGWVAEQTGISLGAMSAIVNGKSDPTLRSARAIARVLGVSIEELWPEEDER
ncbi:hypothetical protein Alches_12340 [Alicyclobacillus hesperidum subsp. aegles]|nr:helix-turn-helix transcriptional regulator [Alicyclobacillus hesperidum]GLG01195.1 hypothetical protein Alches_12340 [Alicyclobacillus hesperidum subsp. aegles]